MTESHLSEKRCEPCEGGTEPLVREEAEKLLGKVNDWALNDDGTHISKEFTFKNFVDAMLFANHVAQIAESEGHHPDLHVSWGKVGIDISTHSIGGLSENDFILAAKIDQIPEA